MVKFTVKQAQVVQMAKDILESDHGITVICLDLLASDEYIMQEGIEECAMQLVYDTGEAEGAFK